MRYGTYLKSPPCPPGGVLLLVLRTAVGLAGESRDLFLGLAGEKRFLFLGFVLLENRLSVWRSALILVVLSIYIIGC